MKASILDQPLPPAASVPVTGWLRAAVTLCLLGLPVVLGYFVCQVQAARHADAFQVKTAQAWMDLPAGQALAAPGTVRAGAAFPSQEQHRHHAALASLHDPRAIPHAALVRVSVPPHKHGRVVDPAAYLHRTRC